jgi:preprotein translocase subunit SecE
MISKITNYFKESYVELKKVTWPTREKTIRDAGLVIAISLGVAAFLGLLDYIFSSGLNTFLSSF